MGSPIARRLVFAVLGASAGCIGALSSACSSPYDTADGTPAIEAGTAADASPPPPLADGGPGPLPVPPGDAGGPPGTNLTPSGDFESNNGRGCGDGWIPYNSAQELSTESFHAGARACRVCVEPLKDKFSIQTAPLGRAAKGGDSYRAVAWVKLDGDRPATAFIAIRVRVDSDSLQVVESPAVKLGDSWQRLDVVATLAEERMFPANAVIDAYVYFNQTPSPACALVDDFVVTTPH